MPNAEILELFDETRPAWRTDGPRPVRTHVWRPASNHDQPKPLVVLSHGSGGEAANFVWYAEALSAEGFLVAAVDHHGNNDADGVLPEGAAFWWERPRDLTVVVDQLTKQETVSTVGVLGYSLGGYTAACVLGARIDAGKFNRLYAGEEILPIPHDRPNIVAETAELVARHGREALEARALADYKDPRFLAGVLLAPAICPILDDASLASIDRPVLVRWGDADDVEVPEDNGVRYARLIPGADGRSMGEHVGHFEFTTDGSVREAVLADVLPFFRTHLDRRQ